MTSYIDKLQALGEKATAGPWYVDDSRPHELMVYPKGGEWACDFPSTEVDCLPDARFVAAARNLWPAIVRVLREADDLEKICADDTEMYAAIFELRQAVDKELGATPIGGAPSTGGAR